MRHWLKLLTVLLSVLVIDSAGAAGTWIELVNQPPSQPTLGVLLADGTALCSDGNSFKTWYKLTPDSSGSYVRGTWSVTAPMIDSRLYFSSQVLPDGRLFVAGGEYGPGSVKAEIYDPLKNSWTPTAPLLATTPFTDIKDAISMLLPNRNVLIAPVFGPSTLIYNPTTDTWTVGPNTVGSGSLITNEVPWLKLPDDSILMLDKNSTAGTSQRYIPSLNQWVADATALDVMYSAGETGCGHLLANGKGFFRGYTHTALYTPSGSTAPGTWARGPDIPSGMNCGDTGGVVLNNGKVLFVAAPGDITPPASFYEYDPTPNTITLINGPTGGPTFPPRPDLIHFLQLPDGNVLVLSSGANAYVYVPDRTPLAAGKPAISGLTQNADGSFHLTGTLFNGISSGAAFGDDSQMDSNYPIVRLTSGSNVYYASTYNWSSTSVQTGSLPVSTEFKLPLNIPAGTYALSVIANGNASATMNMTVPFVSGDLAPTIAQPAAATPGAVTGKTTALSVLGADADGGGEPNLTYTWSVSSASSGSALPTLSINGNNSAKQTTATFNSAGSFTFKVTVTDKSGLSAVSSVIVTVSQVFSSATVTPYQFTGGATGQLTASALDQFGNVMSPQPSLTWSVVTGAGSVTASGFFSAAALGSLVQLGLTSGSIRVLANIYVVSSPWIAEDVGVPDFAGYAYDDGSTYTLAGNGFVGFGSDSIHFVHRTLDGDGDLIARVVSQSSADPGALAGLMIRSSNGAKNPNCSLFLSRLYGAEMDYRKTGGNANFVAKSDTKFAAPYWLKLTRAGTQFTGSVSPDGITWTVFATQTLNFITTPAQAGIFVCTQNEFELSTATFDHVSLNAVAPSATNQAVAVPSNTATPFTLAFNDPNLPPLAPITVNTIASPSKGTLSGTIPNLTYTPKTGVYGADSFQYTATNSANLTSNSATVTFNIFPGNPVANAQTLNVAFNTSFSIVLSGSDPNLPALTPLTFAVTVNPQNGTLSGTAPNLMYSPKLGYSGPDSFQFTATNSAGKASVNTSVNLTVAAGVPTATSQIVNVTFNSSAPLTLTGSDPNIPALPLDYALVVNPQHGTLSGVAPNLTYLPAVNYIGPDSFKFTTTNSNGRISIAATVSISVLNQPPVIASAAAVTPNPCAVRSPAAFNIAVSAPERSALKYAWDFGDATTSTDAAPVHLYSVVGSYLATVSVGDGINPAVTSSVMLSVDPAVALVGNGPDSDGDGFSDAFEAATGSSPADFLSSPTGQAVALGGLLELKISKAQIKLNFAKPSGNDSITFGGTVNVPQGFTPGAFPIFVDVGGVVKKLTLGSKGSVKVGHDSFKVTLKIKSGVVQANQSAPFTATFTKGTFASALGASSQLTNETLSSARRMVSFSMILNNTTMSKQREMLYTSKLNKSGGAK